MLRILEFKTVAEEWNPGGCAVQTREELEQRLMACQTCRFRSGLTCALIGRCVRLAYYAVDASKLCPMGRWPREESAVVPVVPSPVPACGGPCDGPK